MGKQWGATEKQEHEANYLCKTKSHDRAKESIS